MPGDNKYDLNLKSFNQLIIFFSASLLFIAPLFNYLNLSAPKGRNSAHNRAVRNEFDLSDSFFRFLFGNLPRSFTKNRFEDFAARFPLILKKPRQGLQKYPWSHVTRIHNQEQYWF